MTSVAGEFGSLKSSQGRRIHPLFAIEKVQSLKGALEIILSSPTAQAVLLRVSHPGRCLGAKRELHCKEGIGIEMHSPVVEGRPENMYMGREKN